MKRSGRAIIPLPPSADTHRRITILVIIGLKYGDLSNRLFLFSHFIANAIEYEYRLWNPAFDEFRKYFCSTSNDDFGAYPISVKFSNAYPLLNRLMMALQRRNLTSSIFHEYIEIDSPSEEFDLTCNSFIEKAKAAKLIVTSGWIFRDYLNFRKHADIIRSFFRPVSPYKENVESLIRRCKTRSDILIGVHIRVLYDNKTYNYDDDVYYDKMRQLQHQVATIGKNISFLVCSNDKITMTSNESLDIIPGTNHFIEDLYSLAECDYIIGPPSTFSMWASFYGKVPLLHLTDPEQQVDIKDFRVNCG